MDPISVVALVSACVAIARNAAALLTGIADLHKHFSSVATELQGLRARTRAVRTMSNRIHDWLDMQGDTLGTEDRESLLGSLEACEVLVRALSCAINAVDGRRNAADRMSLGQRSRYIWGKREIDRYSCGLNDQSAALVHQLQIIQM
jgi:hypothetical protein